MRVRVSTVLYGLIVLMGPTLFAVFPSWGDHWPVGSKLGVLFIIFLAGVLALNSAAAQQLAEADFWAPINRRASDARRLARARILRGLLSRPEGFPDSYTVRLWAFDADLNRLKPIYGAEARTLQGFLPRQGVVGWVWSTETMIVAEGETVNDGTYLPPALQGQFSDLEVVAALPVFTSRGSRLAVISADSPHNDGFFNTPQGVTAFVELAATVSRVLIDIAGGHD